MAGTEPAAHQPSGAHRGPATAHSDLQPHLDLAQGDGTRGRLRDRATSSWLTCEHCLPLPGDPLTCTLHRAGGRVQGTVHRGGPDRRLRACKQLRGLADGAQLLEGGEEATLTMALLTIAVGRTRYGRTTMAVRR